MVCPLGKDRHLCGIVIFFILVSLHCLTVSSKHHLVLFLSYFHPFYMLYLSLMISFGPHPPLIKCTMVTTVSAIIPQHNIITTVIDSGVLYIIIINVIFLWESLIQFYLGLSINFNHMNYVNLWLINHILIEQLITHQLEDKDITETENVTKTFCKQ